MFDFNSKSNIEFQSEEDLEIKTNGNFAFGIGYNYQNKAGIELRGHTNRNLLSGYLGWQSNYSTLSVILGYNLF